MYPQSDGSSGRMAQTAVDCILKKCDEDGSDPLLRTAFLSGYTNKSSFGISVRVAKQQ